MLNSVQKCQLKTFDSPCWAFWDRYRFNNSPPCLNTQILHSTKRILWLWWPDSRSNKSIHVVDRMEDLIFQNWDTYPWMLKALEKPEDKKALIKRLIQQRFYLVSMKSLLPPLSVNYIVPSRQVHTKVFCQIREETKQILRSISERAGCCFISRGTSGDFSFPPFIFVCGLKLLADILFIRFVVTPIR